MADNRRLIDANALKGKLIRELNKTGKYTPYECGLDDAIAYLDKQPTVDAVEVVHGRWNSVEDIPHFVYACSACGFRVGYGMMLHCNYCPNCGAKMDGDGNG